MSSHVALLANPDEYGYCPRARPAQTGQGDKCSLSWSQVPSSWVVHSMGPQAGLGEAGPPRPHRGTAGEGAALSGLGSDLGTPVSGNTAPVSPRLLLSPHWGKTAKDEVPPLSSIAGLSGDDHTDVLSLRPDPSLAGRPWQKAEESGWRQQRATKGKRISHAERTFS